MTVYCRRMKKISLWLFILAFTISMAHAQDTATQQQIDQINGRLQDLQDMQAVQAKHIEALEKEIGDLRDQLSQPGATADQDGLKKLAEKVQEIDKKRQEDRELILKEIEKLGKVGGPTGRKPTPTSTVTTNQAAASPAASGKESGYEYKVAAGDTLSIIAKAYRDQGIKVTADQILKANPGLNPNSLKVGQKIFIPAPAQ
jgi:LysM repeat protein